jgi:outer membrane protein assembly factor BamC
LKSAFAVTPVRLATLALALALAGCSSTDGLFGSKVDYKAGAAKTAPLEVPPDLSQLAKDSRFQPQGGVISAAASAGPRNTAVTAAPGAPSVAVSQRGDLRIERQGQTRWLVVPGATPEQLWPQVKAFWTQRGFALAVEDAALGVIETSWTENRAKLPNDIIRNTLGRVLGGLYDTGERDLFRTRLERTPNGTEIFVSHRGLTEEYTNDRKESTVWRARAGDPQLEAEFLSRLMLALGAKEEQATPTLVAATPDAPARARTLTGQPGAALEVDEPFDRAWRRVGLALDRSGFSVEDRDRAGGLYYVRYVDPATATQEEPAFWQRWFGGDKTQGPVRYRIAMQASGDKTRVAVQTSAGQPESGANAQRIVGLLVNELR